MTAEMINTLFLGALTYLAHSTLFLVTALAVTSGGLIRSIALKEMILRLALVSALVTAPLQMSGIFDFGTAPIAIPEETAVADTPVFEPRTIAETRPGVTLPVTGAGVADIEPAKNKGTWTTATIALLVWALFGAALLIQLGYLVVDLKSQLSGRRRVSDKRAQTLLVQLSNVLRIQKPALSMKKNLASPFCLTTGEVVIPDWALRLPRHQLKALLAHEMAHLKRRDPAWLITGRIIQGVLFFQPLNFLANRRLAELSEFACDAWAKKVCGSGMALAECLAECAKRQMGHGPAALGMAMATRRSPVIERTRLLLENVRDHSKPAALPAKLAVTAAFVSAGLVIPAFALDEKIEVTEDEGVFGAIFGSGNVMLDNNGYITVDMEYQDSDRTLVIEGKGKLKFDDAETQLTSISNKGYLDIREEAKTGTRRVRWEEEGGKVSETYWLNGDKVAKDDATRQWLARIIPDVYRTTGLDAEGRTKRIFKRSGANGVLDEMAYIRGSYALRMYGATLVAITDLSDKEAGRFMKLAGNVSGSYDLREMLVAFVENETLSDATWKAFAETAGKISGSYDLRETLTAAANSFSGPAGNWRTLLDAAGNISSSYDLRETLTAFSKAMPKDDTTIAELARAAAGVSSSYDLRETLSAYAEEGGYQPGGWLALLDAAKHVSSSYDLRSTLEVFAKHMPHTDALVAKYREVASGISGSYDREQAEKAL